MALEELRPIKQAFLDEYSHFADQRYKNIDKSNVFIVDDREIGGPSIASDGTPYGWFCAMFAEINSPQAVTIIIHGHVPTGASMSAWLKENGVKQAKNQSTSGESFRFVVTPSDLGKLLSLAAALESLIAEPDRKHEKSDFYVCPRMAKCLIRIHGVLAQHWEK